MSAFAKEDLGLLDPAQRAAAAARETWLTAARHPTRQGKQIPPPGDWTELLYVAGRGFGKTAGLVEWQWWENWRVPNLIGHAIGPTINDMVTVLFEGPTGFRAKVPAECLLKASWEKAWDSTYKILTLANGSIIRGFGASDGGDKLRGPQCHNAIGDELRNWDKPAGKLKEAYSNMIFGLRLPYPDGTPSRALCATTPKPIPFLKELQRTPGVRVVRGSTYENVHNLADSFKRRILAYEGTRIGKQEIHAEDVGDEEGSIIQRSWIRLWPAHKNLPEFIYVLQSMDTAFEEENYDVKRDKDPDYSACGIFGVFNTKQCFSEQELKALRIKSKYAAVLCDFWMERLAYPELLERARKSHRQKYGRPGRRPDLVLIEKKASGISLRQSLMTYGVPTWPYDPRDQSKTMRANASSPYFLQGMFLVPESMRPERKGEPRDWCMPLIDQICEFKGEGSIEYDDGLDMTTQAMLHLAERGFFEAVPQDRLKPDPDEAEEAKMREALRQHEASRPRVNPYGA